MSDTLLRELRNVARMGARPHVVADSPLGELIGIDRADRTTYAAETLRRLKVAIAKLGSPLTDAALALFGLADDVFGTPLYRRRQAAADCIPTNLRNSAYETVTVTTFRKRYEPKLLEDLAVILLIDSRSDYAE